MKQTGLSYFGFRVVGVVCVSLCALLSVIQLASAGPTLSLCDDDGSAKPELVSLVCRAVQ